MVVSLKTARADKECCVGEGGPDWLLSASKIYLYPFGVTLLVTQCCFYEHKTSLFSFVLFIYIISIHFLTSPMFHLLGENHAQLAHNAYATLHQRRCNVMTYRCHIAEMPKRCIDVDATLLKRYVPCALWDGMVSCHLMVMWCLWTRLHPNCFFCFFVCFFWKSENVHICPYMSLFVRRLGTDRLYKKPNEMFHLTHSKHCRH